MLYFDYQSAKIKGQFIVLDKDVKINIPYHTPDQIFAKGVTLNSLTKG